MPMAQLIYVEIMIPGVISTSGSTLDLDVGGPRFEPHPRGQGIRRCFEPADWRGLIELNSRPIETVL